MLYLTEASLKSLSRLFPAEMTEAKALLKDHQALKVQVKDLKQKLSEATAPAVSPLTPFGIQLKQLIAYFERKARENERRADKAEKEAASLPRWEKLRHQRIHSGYYFSGKSDSYQKAADKLKAMVEPESKLPQHQSPKPQEQWIVERNFQPLSWQRSVDYHMVYPSKEEAERQFISRVPAGLYRAVQVNIPVKEEWIVEFEDGNVWYRSGRRECRYIYPNELSALKAMEYGQRAYPTSVAPYRVRKVA